MTTDETNLSKLPSMLLPKLSIKNYKPDEDFIYRALNIEDLIDKNKPENWLPNTKKTT